MTMPVQYLDNQLQDNYIHNWLVTGPVITPIQGAPNTDKAQIFSQLYSPDYPLSKGSDATLPADQRAFDPGV
jgi:hypothetical protein